MAVAPQPLIPPHRRSRKPTTSSPQSRRRTAPSPQPPFSIPQKNRSPRLERLPNTGQTPWWLRFLMNMQRSSDVITFILIAATLITYAWTVYTQQLWSREYQKLETLQRHERQMTAASESLKNQLAQQAERPGTGLVSPNPANTIFLPPAPQRQSPAPSTPAAAPKPQLSPEMPLGY